MGQSLNHPRVLGRRRFGATALVALAGVTLSGCNTIEGVGRDIQKAGEGISGAAQETEEAINKPDNRAGDYGY